MNVALIHDKLHIRSLWETKIHVERENVEKEEMRLKKSALCRLRAEWVVRLENRNKHLKKLDTCIQRVDKAKSPDQQDESADLEGKSPDQEDESADLEGKSPDQEDESPDQEDESADQEDESPDQEDESADLMQE
ncbi:putative surface protein bspA-like [Synchiropus splendidus]|uniref:putative surface protein bspA-like n=1 Tax=Synchiropus splendidus TaxID=270530 RepID=UPI00237DB9E4|nr:putative surface protein bspA-like [Synchiropus splendidus]